MNTIINPVERAEFWKNRLVALASKYAEPNQQDERRAACRRLWIDDWKQMRAEQETGECAEVDGFWSQPFRVAVRDLEAVAAGMAAAQEPESPYVAKLRSQIVKEKNDDIRILQEALAAAEAECAAARKLLVKPVARDGSDIWGRFVTETVGNDATRARLGLPKIGEGK
jgi:hypothetical protein